MKNNVKRVGEKIRQIRTDAGLSQPVFAKSIDISHKTLTNIEIGRNVTFSISIICKIKEIYGVSVAYLFDEEEELRIELAELQIQLEEMTRKVKEMQNKVEKQDTKG